VHGLLHGVNARSAIKVVTDAELWTDLAMLLLGVYITTQQLFFLGALFVCYMYLVAAWFVGYHFMFAH
jgi:hypothetical protein